MLAKLALITLTILCHVANNRAQTVQEQPIQESCPGTPMKLTCPNRTVIVVREAFYGVSNTPGKCSYTPGDCIIPTEILTCVSDSSCTLSVAKQRRPECNNQYQDYLQVQYDCVPIVMDDSSREFTICQDTAPITATNGIIRSPGYPKSQITSGECLTSIQIPDDKTVRVWLSDLSIAPVSAGSCAKNHVYLVDSVQTYRYCGTRRIAFPYLCSPTILIQYLVTTSSSLYRGMRIYFEVVDRDSNNNCPSQNTSITPQPISTTPITTFGPDTTTPLPPYALLGIASSILNVQLCNGDTATIKCPNNYGIAITRNLYGVGPTNKCENHQDDHCFVPVDAPFFCQQSCTYVFLSNVFLSNCQNRLATYQYVEYQCIPTQANLISNTIACPTDGSRIPIKLTGPSRFQNLNYPQLQVMNCTYRLSANPDQLIKIYSLDINLNDRSPDCTSNRLQFIEGSGTDPIDICDEVRYRLLYTSCSNEMDLRYIIGDAAKFISTGFDLYIEPIQRPNNWDCGTTQSTSTLSTVSTSTFTTPSAETPTTSDSDMFSQDEVEHDICQGRALNYRCPTGYTFIIIGAYYGVKQQSSSSCAYTQGDCTQDATGTITACDTDDSNCYLNYGNKVRLALCGDKFADYLHITSQCIPSKPNLTGSSLRVVNICDSNDDIYAGRAIITSPNFPSYQKVDTVCRRTVIVDSVRAMKIWINQLNIASGNQQKGTDGSDGPDVVIRKSSGASESDDSAALEATARETCSNNYLLINGPQVAYVYCGKQKRVIDPICGAQVTFQYTATASPNIFYRGFKLYYETFFKPADINCGAIIDPITTTPINEPWPFWAQNLELSPILPAQICLGDSGTLRCARQSDYALAIIDARYYVTGTGQCDRPSTSSCNQVTTINAPCSQSCRIVYDIPKILTNCGNQRADSLNIDYECIPTRLPNNENPIDICSTSQSDSITEGRGIINSPKYPTLQGFRRCKKQIRTVPGKLWKIFLVDLFVESEDSLDQCSDSSLTINDGNEARVLCGSQQPELIMISCSNIVDFEFFSSGKGLNYRGFKIYYETMDQPPTWPCVPTSQNSTTRATTSSTMTTVPTTTLVPPSLQILAFGGTTNGTQQYCVFPFKYQGQTYSDCLRTDPPTGSASANVQPWCSTTADFDTNQQWGFCNLGVTQSTTYDICRNEARVLACPPGYLIDIVRANFGAKPDGSTSPNSCSFSQIDCFQRDQFTLQALCAGKQNCTARHTPLTLVSCQNRPSAYLHVNYVCVPSTLPEITAFNLCDNTTVPDINTRRGFLISPLYPSAVNNLDCTYNLQTVTPHQDIDLYAVDINLNNPVTIGQTCTKDVLTIATDSEQRKLCGTVNTDFLLTTCRSSISLKLFRAADAKGRGLKLYFEFRDRSPDEPCPDPITTPTPGPISSTTTKTTVSPPSPACFPDPCPRRFKTLCYPDVTGLFGNNFQCPSSYVMVIHQAFYGVGSRCEYTSGDCTTVADIVYEKCSGQQACSINFLNEIKLPDCDNNRARYLFVEYQCLPTFNGVSYVSELCSSNIAEVPGVVTGILTSASYPNYVASQCANISLNHPVNLDLVTYIYLLNLNIAPKDSTTDECVDDYISFTYQCRNQWMTRRLCGSRSTEVLFDTCIPTDQAFVTYNISGQYAQSEGGFAILYYFAPYAAINFTQPTIPMTTTSTTTTSTRTTITSTTSILGPGPTSSSIIPETSPVGRLKTIRCDSPNYVLIIHKVYLYASTSASAVFSPDDCYEDRTSFYNLCGGKQSCAIFPPSISISGCNGSRSTTLYTEHQCIPSRPKLNIDVCSSSGSVLRVEGGARIFSGNYTSSSQSCDITLLSNPLLGSQTFHAFNIYILSLNMPIQRTARDSGTQCSDDYPYIEIVDDNFGVTRLCGLSHSRFLMETCASGATLRFRNFLVTSSSQKFTGFELYLESITREKCTVDPNVTPPPLTSPLVISSAVLCSLAPGRASISFGCQSGSNLLFLQSHEFVTQDPISCDINQNTCHFPSTQPQSQCSGQETCTFFYNYASGFQGGPCSNSRPDSIEFFYQCLPSQPTLQYPRYTFCSNTIVNSIAGFIETQNFPNSYDNGRQNCQIVIPLPSDNNVELFSVYLYVIELSLRDSAPDDAAGGITCLDAINYTDGNTTKSLCGVIDQPRLVYSTNMKNLSLTLDFLSTPSSDQTTIWRGARLFFIVGDQNLPKPPAPVQTTTTSFSTGATGIVTVTANTNPSTMATTSASIENPEKKPGNYGWIAAVVIVGVAIIIGIGVFIYRRQKSTSTATSTKITYDTATGEMSGTSNIGFASRDNSISVDYLKKSPSAFTNPLYKKVVNSEKPSSDA